MASHRRGKTVAVAPLADARERAAPADRGAPPAGAARGGPCPAPCEGAAAGAGDPLAAGQSGGSAGGRQRGRPRNPDRHNPRVRRAPEPAPRGVPVLLVADAHTVLVGVLPWRWLPSPAAAHRSDASASAVGWRARRVAVLAERIRQGAWKLPPTWLQLLKRRYHIPPGLTFHARAHQRRLVIYPNPPLTLRSDALGLPPLASLTDRQRRECGLP